MAGGRRAGVSARSPSRSNAAGPAGRSMPSTDSSRPTLHVTLTLLPGAMYTRAAFGGAFQRVGDVREAHQEGVRNVSSHRVGVVAVLAAAILLPVSAGHAQGPNSNFAALPGLSRTQQITAAAIQRVCEQLSQVTQQTSAQRDLSARCGEMVSNSNALQGFGPTGSSLGLTTEGLAAVVSRIAPDEVASQGTGAVELSSKQFQALAGRLASLRAGAPGLSLTGLKLDIGGKSLTGDRLLQPEQGGGA